MLRLKNKHCASNFNQAQSAIEYLLLLAVVTSVVLVAFGGKYLQRVHNAANLYFDRAAVGIYGNASACGDGVCSPGETYEKCPIDHCVPEPEPPDPGDCEPHRRKSGTCPTEFQITKILNHQQKTIDCTSQNGCTGNYVLECNDHVITEVSSSCAGPGGSTPEPQPSGCALQTPPVSLSTGSCETQITINFNMNHEESSLIRCEDYGCVPANPDPSATVSAYCYNGEVSMLGVCHSTDPAKVPATTDCVSEFSFTYDENGCKGEVTVGPLADGVTSPFACPLGCSGSVTATCTKGTYYIDPTSSCSSP